MYISGGILILLIILGISVYQHVCNSRDKEYDNKSNIKVINKCIICNKKINEIYYINENKYYHYQCYINK